MKDINPIDVHNEEADSYDSNALAYEYFAHEAMFGMCYEYILPGQELLDMGIGTGLASQVFADLGMQVTGFDGAENMLHLCAAKGFAKELIQHDLNDLPFPFPDAKFALILASGVFHFFDDIAPSISECSRLLLPNGVFGFTVGCPEDDFPVLDDSLAIPLKHPTAWGVPIYLHSYQYLSPLLQSIGFDLLKRQRLILRGGTENQPDLTFAIYIVRKSF